MGQKLQFSKTCEKPLLIPVRAALCKKKKNKQISKTHNIRKITTLSAWPNLVTIGACSAIAFAKLSLWAKNYNSQKHARNHSSSTLELLRAKIAFKNTYNSRGKKFSNMAKFGHYGKAMVFAKLLLWVKNCNSQKDAKNYPRDALELLCTKDSSQKHNIRKITHCPPWPNLATIERL